MIVYLHPTCSTCKKVVKQLQEFGYQFEQRDIRQQTPDFKFFENLINNNISRKLLLNTSGNKYKELKLKDTVEQLTDEAFIKLLLSDGMLIKRPIVWDKDIVTFGSRDIEKVWKK